jgi:hypothetical protein
MESAFEKVPEDPGKLLLKGSLSPSEFFKELLARDQATGNRRGAIANIEILTRPEISEFFRALPEELSGYENFLSLSYFHRGQLEATEERDNGAAAASFSQALSWARQAEASDPDYHSWRLYVEGTLAYFESDLATLKEVYDGGIEEDRNREIIGNLIYTLETEGRVDYRRAYGM